MVRTRVEERDEVAEIELRQEDVTVERVARGVPVESVPETREEDGVLIIPVLEEQLVVSTRLILKEEIRITRRSRTELVREPVRLRAEQADIERLAGRPLPQPTQPTLTEGAPSMTVRTLTAMYDSRDAAASARDQLVGLGIPAGDISVHGAEAGTTTEPATEERGFWASLFLPEEDRQVYAEGVQRGGFLLTVEVEDDLEAAALDVLENSGRWTSTPRPRPGARAAGRGRRLSGGAGRCAARGGCRCHRRHGRDGRRPIEAQPRTTLRVSWRATR